jgi:hypothetical protein
MKTRSVKRLIKPEASQDCDYPVRFKHWKIKGCFRFSVRLDLTRSYQFGPALLPSTRDSSIHSQAVLRALERKTLVVHTLTVL